MHALAHNVGAYLAKAIGISPQLQTGNGTITGTLRDRQGHQSLRVLCELGAVTGTPDATSVVFTVEQTADASGSPDTPAAITGATVTLTAENTQGVIDVDLDGVERYVRVKSVTTFTGGSSPKVQVSAPIILGPKDVIPVA
jgi:hypothetical protein